MYPAEPWASWTDTVTASQFLEQAIHAQTGDGAAQALGAAQSQLLHAAAYWTTYQRQDLATRWTAVADELGTYAGHVGGLSGSALTTYQSTVLYAYQGTMAGLAYTAQRMMPSSRRITWGFVMGGIGLVATGVGIYVAVRSQRR